MFSGEQGVSIAADRDGRDHESTHLVAVEERARGRHLPAAVPRSTSRGWGGSRWSPSGAARASRRRCSSWPTGWRSRQGADAISLHAQTYARRLYLDAGYEERGPEFVEEGIEHVAMGKRLDPSGIRR